MDVSLLCASHYRGGWTFWPRVLQWRPREIVSQYQDAIAEVHRFIAERGAQCTKLH